MRKVGIDCRFASEFTGLGTYTRSLVRSLLLVRDGWSYVLFVTSTEESWLKDLDQSRFEIRTASFPHYSLKEQIFFPRVVASEKCDLFFAPHFNVSFELKIPFICTIHDLILHRFPNNASWLKRLAYRTLVRNAVSKARRIIAVSRHTASEIKKYYGQVAGAKTEVIYSGIDSLFHSVPKGEQDSIKHKYGLKLPYLIYVGNCKQHKNVRFLTESFYKADLADTELVLVCSGLECRKIDFPKRIRILSGVPITDLPALYGAASGYVTASLAEGFGFPVLEALAVGCPVLATNQGSFPEILNGHGLIAVPEQNEFVSCMEKLRFETRDPKDSEAAQKWALSFNWTKTAEAVAHLIETELESI